MVVRLHEAPFRALDPSELAAWGEISAATVSDASDGVPRKPHPRARSPRHRGSRVYPRAERFCGQSLCSEVERATIPCLVDAAAALLDRVGIHRFHLVGHSTEGLTALMLADAHPTRVESFCSIEGNVAPENCFLSGQILQYPEPDPVLFLEALAEPA